MGNIFLKLAKILIPENLKKKIYFYQSLKNSLKPLSKRNCNICKFKGYFKLWGKPLRIDALCPNCGSLERHRLLKLAIDKNFIKNFNNENSFVLHFAAEPILKKILSNKFNNYHTADLKVGPNFERADLKLDIEKINIQDKKYDFVIANHVLEHVNDHKAASELSRILKDNGILICMVPIIEGWATTYENDNIVDEKDRWLHFGQNNHLRYYGKDFRKRISNGGFDLITEITASGDDVIKYSLIRGEKVFIFQKLLK